MQKSDFRIVLDNISHDNPAPAYGIGAYYIQYFGREAVSYVGIGEKSLLRLVQDPKEQLHFKNEGEANRRLDHALEQQEFENDPLA